MLRLEFIMKRHIGLVLLMVVLVTAALRLISRADDPEGLDLPPEKLISISAEFIQEKQMRILSHPIISSGVFYFRYPDSLRWEYTFPVRSILLMHNGKTNRYIQQDAEMLKDSGAHLQSMQVVFQEFGPFLSGRFHESTSFVASIESGRKILLTPKAQSLSSMIQRIEIVPSDRPGVIESVTIFESDDSFTRLIFKNATLNREIPDLLFREM